MEGELCLRSNASWERSSFLEGQDKNPSIINIQGFYLFSTFFSLRERLDISISLKFCLRNVIACFTETQGDQ